MMKKVIKKLARKSPPKKQSIATKSRSKTPGNISSEEFCAMVQKKAYELFEKRGFYHGDDQADWYKAEKAVLTSLKKKK